MKIYSNYCDEIDGDRFEGVPTFSKSEAFEQAKDDIFHATENECYSKAYGVISYDVPDELIPADATAKDIYDNIVLDDNHYDILEAEVFEDYCFVANVSVADNGLDSVVVNITVNKQDVSLVYDLTEGNPNVDRIESDFLKENDLLKHFRNVDLLPYLDFAETVTIIDQKLSKEGV